MTSKKQFGNLRNKQHKTVVPYSPEQEPDIPQNDLYPSEIEGPAPSPRIKKHRGQFSNKHPKTIDLNAGSYLTYISSAYWKICSDGVERLVCYFFIKVNKVNYVKTFFDNNALDRWVLESLTDDEYNQPSLLINTPVEIEIENVNGHSVVVGINFDVENDEE